jgi:hypothetical protein
MEYFLNFLNQYYPQVGIYAATLFFVIAVTVKIHGFYLNMQTVKGKTEKLEDKMPDIELKMKMWQGKTEKLEDKMPKIEIMFSKIETGLILLNKMLLEKTIISQSCYSNENSPRTINDIGQSLLKESGANKIFEAKKKMLLSDLELKTINSLLELEREALNVMLAHGDDLDYKPVQDFAFEHPTYQGNPLTYTDILFIMALKLRDFYQVKHPELTSSENPL